MILYHFFLQNLPIPSSFSRFEFVSCNERSKIHQKFISHQSIYLSIYLSISQSIYLSICLSVNIYLVQIYPL